MSGFISCRGRMLNDDCLGFSLVGYFLIKE